LGEEAAVPVGEILVFRGGTVFDGRRFAEPGTCVWVRGEKIIAVGPDPGPAVTAGAVEAGELRRAEPVDLAGGTLLPGFIDAHVHPVFAGDQLRRCNLREGSSAEEYLEIIARYAAAHPELEWITGGGWSMEAFPRGLPTREPLDAVTGDRPVFLPNRDGHGAWVNTAALRRAGIDAATPDPPDGRIERDVSGEPTGALQEGAMSLVSRLLPEPTDADRDQALDAAQDYLLSLGVTGWQDAIIGGYRDQRDNLPAYLRAAREGRLTVNVTGALWWDRERGLDQLPELLDRRRAGTTGRFRATSVKMMLDGVAETHTAAMLEPYLGDDGCSGDHTGLDFIDPQELPRFVTALDREGFQVHFHALGDRAVRHALDAIEAARRANGPSGPRHHLAHIQVVHPDDILRFAALGATANMQALWAAHEPQMDVLTIPFLGERRAGWQYPFRSLQAAGAALAAGSDWSVSSPNPLWAAHVAVNRALPRAAGGTGTEGPFLPEQALDLPAFLSAYTFGSARVNGLEDVTGAIRPGLDADFAIVDADLSRIPDAEIGTATVTATWVRGRPVWQRP
jgi:predicted amidohydrolase YtcJ